MYIFMNDCFFFFFFPQKVNAFSTLSPEGSSRLRLTLRTVGPSSPGLGARRESFSARPARLSNASRRPARPSSGSGDPPCLSLATPESRLLVNRFEDLLHLRVPRSTPSGRGPARRWRWQTQSRRNQTRQGFESGTRSCCGTDTPVSTTARDQI